MKNILTLFILFISIHHFAQIDKNGNPVFNSISINDETFDDFQLLSNYYTLKNNIENKGSSVFISEKPTLDEIERSAINLPSDFFVLMKNRNAINLVMILNSPTRQFFVINPSTSKQLQFPLELFGEISENRANEIIKERFDPQAKIVGNKLYFNDKKFEIISNKEIKKEVLKLIKNNKLNESTNTTVQVYSKEDLRLLVLEESKVGGKLDFFTEIKGSEMDGIQIKPGVFSTNIGIALYKWGRANFELGTSTVEDALEFWKDLKGREPNQREKEYIKLTCCAFSTN